MPARWVVALFFLLPGSIRGAEAPAIRRQGVVNAASQRPVAVGGAIARGSRISIYGVRFGAASGATRVSFKSATGEVRWLAVIEADPQRLEAWIPADAPLGPARIAVSAKGLESAPETVTVLKAAPGLFSTNGQGWGPARAENLSGAMRSPNSTANSVAPGNRLALAVTGLAPSDKPEIRVGNSAARVLQVHAAAAPAYTAEITIQIPEASAGCYVPVYVRLPGVPVSNAVTISVHRGGGKCVSAADDPVMGWQGGKTAILSLTRTVRRSLDAPGEHIEDEANGAFRDVPPGKARATPLLLLPPAGVCTTWAGALKAGTTVGSSIWALLFSSIPGEGLDAGDAISIRSRTVQMKAQSVAGEPGLYRRMLSAGAGRAAPRNRLSLDAGPLGIAGPGGAQVGPFAISVPAPVAFTVSNPTADPVNRPRPLTLEWSAGNGDGSLAIVIFGADANLNVAGLVYCNSPQAAGRFTIPAELLAQLPPGRGSLVMASWWGRALTPPPHGIGWMMALSVFARSSEILIQ